MVPFSVMYNVRYKRHVLLTVSQYGCKYRQMSSVVDSDILYSVTGTLVVIWSNTGLLKNGKINSKVVYGSSRYWFEQQRMVAMFKEIKTSWLSLKVINFDGFDVKTRSHFIIFIFSTVFNFMLFSNNKKMYKKNLENMLLNTNKVYI